MLNEEIKRLLELAAKTVGIEYRAVSIAGVHGRHPSPWLWRPHLDDGDCFRLQVATGIEAISDNAAGLSYARIYEADDMDPAICIIEPHAHHRDACAATRLAVLRCAASAVGKKP